MNGIDLLAEFRKRRAEGAFGELVRRYTNLVYSVAKRRLGNVSQAQEVTQTVFIRLARSVPNVRGDAQLVAWLHRTTVHASIDLWRSEIRRRAREEHSVAMQPQPAENSTWNEISPVLDEALNELNDAERQVILLRFFEQRSMRDLGLALGISEDAAKMRVSRAMEHLRTLFSERAVVCGTVTLGALMTDRAVEAAPAGLVLTLATLQIPAAAGLGTATDTTAILAQTSRAKLVASLSAAVVIGALTIIWLVSAKTGYRAATRDRTALNPAPVEHAQSAVSASKDTNTAAAERALDPVKLLQGVTRARNRIISGEMEFEVATYEFDRAFEGTNRVRLKARFDGTKRRFESFAREYAYTSMAADAQETTDTRMRTYELDQEAAVQAGLLKPFESHHVRAFDGAVMLDYWENDGKAQQVRIEDPAKGSGYLFDPRCLGIDPWPNVNDTIESCLHYDNPNSVQLVAEEPVEGMSTWHVRVWRGTMAADFWVETTNPTRVLKHVFNGSEVVSKYDDSNPRDPLPTEVMAMQLHGTIGTQTAFTQFQIVRRSAQFNLAVDPASWTLAGLGMKIGTDVVDYRISRSIGYWTGTCLSQNLPRNTRQQEPPPDRAELLAVLANEPDSPSGLQVAQWVIFNTPDGPDVEKAAEVILKAHIQDTNLAPLCRGLERLRPRSSRRLLEAMLDKNPSPEVRGNACFTLATLRKEEAKYGQNSKATAEAAKLFERVIKDFGRVKLNGTMLAELAKPELAELRQLAIGKTAPENQGEDFEGRSIRLSDYRGNVVLLIFWGECGGCRPEVAPLLDLLARLNDKPFAILGVYCDKDLAKAKAIVEESGISWPSVRDGRSGPISTAWNNHHWPAFDLVDTKGIIRYRNLSELKVSEAVDALMKE